ncbi:hypothetical protein [Lysobacter sp. P5_B9]
MKNFLPILAMLLVGCAKHSEPPTFVYVVTGFTASSGEWVVDQIDRAANKRTRFTLVCDFYHSGKNQIVPGTNSCDLTAGETIVPNPLGQQPGEFVDVWPRGDKLSITRGDGDSRVLEQFTVKSARAIAYAGGI